MLTARDLSHGLYGAWRLARLDSDAMRYFDVSIEAFWKSFYAAAIVLPVYVIVTAFRLAHTELADEIGLLEIVIVEASSYVMYWVAFPLLMISISDVLQRGERYLGYIIAMNWAQVVEQVIFLPVFVLTLASGRDLSGPNPILVIALFVVAFYYWYIARTALSISGWAAGGIVILYLFVAGAIENFAFGLLH